MEKYEGITREFATDHIWTMEDRPGFIGLRVDCGDSGVIYFTPDQARQVIDQFQCHLESDLIRSLRAQLAEKDAAIEKAQRDALEEAAKHIEKPDNRFSQKYADEIRALAAQKKEG